MISLDLTRLRDPQRRAVHMARLRKNVTGQVRLVRRDTVPVFVLGLQRSGTNMLTDVLHLRSDTEVYSESRSNPAFSQYLLRDLDVIEDLINRSWGRYVCFKPISDSHRANELIDRFPSGRFVWIFRRYQDVANSRLRLFPQANRAITLVCRGESGGGWFDAGVSPATRKILRRFDVDNLSEFDLACLTWWARNSIFIEQQLWRRSNIITVRYENLAAEPLRGFEQLFAFLGMPHSTKSLRFVRKTSIGKHPAGVLTPEVKELCESLSADLGSYVT